MDPARKEQERLETLNFLRQPGQGIIALMRYPEGGGGREFGFALSLSGGPAKPIIYMKDMFDLKEGISLGEQLEGVKTYVYDTIEALAADGWMVD